MISDDVSLVIRPPHSSFWRFMCASKLFEDQSLPIGFSKWVSLRNLLSKPSIVILPVIVPTYHVNLGNVSCCPGRASQSAIQECYAIDQVSKFTVIDKFHGRTYVYALQPLISTVESLSWQTAVTGCYIHQYNVYVIIPVNLLSGPAPGPHPPEIVSGLKPLIKKSKMT
jgi:hypothetical protein